MPNKLTFPIILDMVEDKVRNRFVTALFVLMSYIIVIFVLVLSINESNPTVQDLQQEIDMKSTYNLNSDIGNISPYPRVKVRHDNSIYGRFLQRIVRKIQTYQV